MFHQRFTVMKISGRESTRSLRKIEERRGKDILQLNLTVLQTRIQSPLILTVSLTLIYHRRHRLILVHQVMKDVRKRRDLLEGTDTSVVKGGTRDVRRGAGSVIGSPNANQKGYFIIFIKFLTVCLILFIMFWNDVHEATLICVTTL